MRILNTLEIMKELQWRFRYKNVLFICEKSIKANILMKNKKGLDKQ